MPPTPLRAIVGLLGLATLASALVLAIAGLFTTPVAWALAGFEAITAAASLVALRVAWPRPLASTPLALVCVAGTIVGATVLGYVGTNPHQAGPFQLAPWALARLAAAALLAAVAGLLALGHDRDAWRRLAVGLLLAAPVLVVLGLLAYAPARSAILSGVGGLPGPILALAGLVAFLVLTGLVAASAQLLITAFTPSRERSAA